MLKVKNLAPPSPDQFYAVIKGMRLPFKSGDKSDSGLCGSEDCGNCSEYDECWGRNSEYTLKDFHLGDKDQKLLLNLCRAGDPSHRKVLRQLPVIMDITAPLYWWKQMDQYKIGTVTNSESTMHTITKESFVSGDFSFNNIYPDEEAEMLDVFNNIRNRYLVGIKEDNPYTQDRAWGQLIELLPEAYNQTRCWSANYEVLLNIINQRSGHKLSEWKTFIDYILENVPYLNEIYEAINDRGKS